MRIIQTLIQAVLWGGPLLFANLFGRRPSDREVADRLTGFITALGATYVKFGQYLALRRDLLPATVAEELSNLFEAVRPMGPRDVRRVVETELGQLLEAVFVEFEWVPTGAGSIAQVHRAVDRQGRRIALKVQRRGVARLLRVDLANLKALAWLSDVMRLTGVIRLKELIGEMAEFTLREVDFETEGGTADRLRIDVPAGVRVPLIYWDLSTPKLLAMEYVEGISLLKFNQAAERGDWAEVAPMLGETDLEELIDRLANACMTQIFEVGFFHGDPHPANVLIATGGEVVFIDFGIFGEIDDELRVNLIAYLEKLSIGDLEGTYRRYLRMASPSDEADMRAFRREVLATHAVWRGASLDPRNSPPAERLIAYHQGRLFDVLRRHRVRIPRNQMLLWRSLSVLDATSQRLPVHFDLLRTLRAYFADTLPNDKERIESVLKDARAAVLTAASPDVSARARAAAARSTGRVRRVRQEIRAPLRARRDANRRTMVAVSSLLLLGAAMLVGRL